MKNIKINIIGFVLAISFIGSNRLLGNNKMESLGLTENCYVTNIRKMVNFNCGSDSITLLNCDSIREYVKQRIKVEYPQFLNVNLLEVYIKNLFMSYKEKEGQFHNHSDEYPPDGVEVYNKKNNPIDIKELFYNDLIAALLIFHNDNNLK